MGRWRHKAFMWSASRMIGIASVWNPIFIIDTIIILTQTTSNLKLKIISADKKYGKETVNV